MPQQERRVQYFLVTSLTIAGFIVLIYFLRGTSNNIYHPVIKLNTSTQNNINSNCSTSDSTRNVCLDSDEMANKTDVCLIIEEMKNEPRLNLMNSNLTILPPCIFFNNKVLRYLYLGGNPLIILSDKVWLYHQTIEYLDITDCNLPVFDLHVFEGLKNLKVINLGGNPGCKSMRSTALETRAQYEILCDK